MVLKRFPKAECDRVLLPAQEHGILQLKLEQKGSAEMGLQPQKSPPKPTPSSFPKLSSTCCIILHG